MILLITKIKQYLLNNCNVEQLDYWVSVVTEYLQDLQVSVGPPPVLGNKQLRPQQLVSNSSNCQLVPTVNHNLGVVKIATVL